MKPFTKPEAYKNINSTVAMTIPSTYSKPDAYKNINSNVIQYNLYKNNHS